MNEFDQFAKHKLKVKYYIRYADDFVIFSQNKQELEKLVPKLKHFLEGKLKLTLHPNKISIKTLYSGIDFLGWINFSNHRVLRKATQRRILKRIKEKQIRETLNSYLGLLKHGNTFLVQSTLLSQVNEY
jgi:retron-type reverse transcriptase